MFGSDSPFFFHTADDGEDDPEPLDFTFDGEGNGAKGPGERRSVIDLRRHIEEYASDGDAEKINLFIDDLYNRIEDAIEQCGIIAKRTPDRIQFFVASVKLYEASLDALDMLFAFAPGKIIMYSCNEKTLDMLSDSLLLVNFDGVDRARLGFEVAVADIDALNSSEAERQKAA